MQTAQQTVPSGHAAAGNQAVTTATPDQVSCLVSSGATTGASSTGVTAGGGFNYHTTARTGIIEPHEVVGETLYIDSANHSENETDRDSAYGDDGLSSASSSLSARVQDFRHYGGRRYHAFDDSLYWLPNDEEEITRLELQHLIWRVCLNGRLYIAPVPENVQRVVDLGTGTGKWAIEFADQHPSAEVIGTDLSPIQPHLAPPNCSFIVDNVEEDWVYNQPFDYIHSRMLCLGMHNWRRYFQQCWDNLKPGGWTEVQETGFPLESASGDDHTTSPLLKWSTHIKEAAANDGINADSSGTFRGILEDIGFVNIMEQPLQWPIGPWPRGEREKIIGRIMVENMKQFIKPSAMALFTKRLKWSTEEVDEFIPLVMSDLDDRRKNYYVRMRIICGQKPESATA